MYDIFLQAGAGRAAQDNNISPSHVPQAPHDRVHGQHIQHAFTPSPTSVFLLRCPSLLLSCLWMRFVICLPCSLRMAAAEVSAATSRTTARPRFCAPFRSELRSHLADIGNETARLGEEMRLRSTHNEAKGSLDRSSGAGHVDDAIQSARHTFPPS